MRLKYQKLMLGLIKLKIASPSKTNMAGVEESSFPSVELIVAIVSDNVIDALKNESHVMRDLQSNSSSSIGKGSKERKKGRKI